MIIASTQRENGLNGTSYHCLTLSFFIHILSLKGVNPFLSHGFSSCYLSHRNPLCLFDAVNRLLSPCVSHPSLCSSHAHHTFNFKATCILYKGSLFPSILCNHNWEIASPALPFFVFSYFSNFFSFFNFLSP
jgi:hypothetical protein